MTVYEPRPVLLTFLLILFQVLVVNESVIVIGLYKFIKGSGQPSILQLSPCCVTTAHVNLLQDDVNDNFVGKLFRLKSKIEVLKTSVQSTCDANQIFYTSRASIQCPGE